MTTEKIPQETIETIRRQTGHWLSENSNALKTILEAVAEQVAPLVACEVEAKMVAAFDRRLDSHRILCLASACLSACKFLECGYAELDYEARREVCQLRNQIEQAIAFAEHRQPVLWDEPKHDRTRDIPF